jgi:predicted membrane channel-forming protein YqfA (hemolysin III family)
MANRSFQLRRSRLAFVFQLIIFILLMALLQQLLPAWLWVICILLAVIGYAYGLKVPEPIYFEHLDAREWSLLSAQSEQVKRVSVSHMIDHQLYIVVYFQHFRAKPLLIWIDQLPRQQWKALKKLAKLI